MVDFLYHGSAIAVLPFWGLMILAPRWTWTERAVSTPWIILPPALCYAALLLPNLAQVLGPSQESGPEGLALLMSHPWAAAVFFAYAGAFDLFVGRWMFFDARVRGIGHLLLAPTLLVCIFFGPIAFLMYATLCALKRRAPTPAPA